MYDYIVLDGETTTFQKGNPYSQQNKLCLVGIHTSAGETETFDIEYSDHSYSNILHRLQNYINETNLLILFNAKFDLAWLRRYKINYSHCRVFDCQLAAFILSGQTYAYPSLNGVAEAFGLGTKLDVVKEEYWDKGIDTQDIPLSILSEYLEMDLLLTHQVYEAQLRVLSSQSIQMQRLISLSNQDLLVLLEMEYNGLMFDFKGMQQASDQLILQIESITNDLISKYPEYPAAIINLNSGDVVSCLLFGGTILETIRTEVGLYKSGPKSGQPRYKLSTKEHIFPRLCEPPKGSQLKKEGYFATNEATLRSVKAKGTTKETIEQILTLSKLEKLNGTYYLGLQALHKEKDWEYGIVHGQFNQCVARTGRLSSSSPNLQNFPGEIDQFTVTRYG